MATIFEELNENLVAFNEEKQLQKSALEEKGQDMTDVPFTQYHEKIKAIQTGGGEDRLQWKCDNVKSLYFEFEGYGGQEIPNLKGLDTSKVTRMSYVFYNCSNLIELDLSSWNTGNVTNMSNIFYGCNNLVSVNLNGWNTNNVADMQRMFNTCSKLKSFNFTSWNTSNVTNISYMFNGCNELETIPNIDLIKATNINGLFSNCRALKDLTIYNIKKTLTIGSGTSWGTKLTLDSIVNIIKELWDLTGSTSQTLYMSTASKNLIANVYVKLVDVTDDMLSADQYASSKKPCVVCESTDEGAMLITEYLTSKNWTLA